MHSCVYIYMYQDYVAINTDKFQRHCAEKAVANLISFFSVIASMRLKTQRNSHSKRRKVVHGVEFYCSGRGMVEVIVKSR